MLSSADKVSTGAAAAYQLSSSSTHCHGIIALKYYHLDTYPIVFAVFAGDIPGVPRISEMSTLLVVLISTHSARVCTFMDESMVIYSDKGRPTLPFEQITEAYSLPS